jgi:hypothetical protein
MSGWEMKIITAETQRLLALAASDPDLRAELRALAEEILRATETAQPESESQLQPQVQPELQAEPELQPEVEPASTPPPREELAPQATQVEAPLTKEPLRALTLGQGRSSPPAIARSVGAPAQPAARDVPFPDIEGHCRLKAEGARWAAARQRRLREGSDYADEIAPDDPEITAWADRLLEDFFWAGVNNGTGPADIALLDDVAGCFEAFAAAIRLLLDGGMGHQGRLERTLPLLAEAQSALRAAIQKLRRSDEPEQMEVFEWLKTTAARRQIFIKRFMRVGDPADPTGWIDLIDRIEETAAKHRKSGGRSPEQESTLNQIGARLKRIEEGEAAEEDWPEVIREVNDLVAGGLPPSNREIRELLLPVIEGLPEVDDLPEGFQLVLREIDRFLATRRPATDLENVPAPTAAVLEARRLLQGRSLVLIGGVRRRESQRLLKSALGLAELIWIETREHQSIAAFEPAVARPEVSLVLLAIRWTSHAFGDVKQFCDRYGKPLVRLPGGYGPNQVAAQIVAQCSGQLGGP